MNYRNKLIGVSFIALAALSACTDETENGGRTLPGDRSLSFAVSTKGANSWKPANGTRAVSAPATQELDPIEMQGKLNGETVYLTTEVTDGFPGDNNRPMTRGTQITDTDKKTLMKTFGVSAYTNKDGKPDYMHNETATLDDNDGYWYPQEKYYWPTGKQLSFYAWYPTAADGLTLTDNPNGGAPEINYTVPEEVTKQQDVMYAVATGKDDPTTTDGYATTNLEFNHALSAVRFVTGDNMAECTINSISINGVKYIGKYDMKTESWSLQDKTNGFFNLTVGTDFDGTAGVDITEEGQTFFMIPQTLTSDAVITVNLTIANTTSELSAKLADLTTEWEKGKTYTYHLSAGRISAEVTFFKGVNGTDGNPYTSHNISANGAPFTVDLKYPSSVMKITARFAYEVTDVDGNITYESIKEGYDLTNKTTADFTSPCLNNMGDPTKAKKDETPFVVQIQVDGRMMMQMPKDPDDPDTQKVYNPDADANTWYTVWRGTMFPPNYILEGGTAFSSYIARKNLMVGTSYQGIWSSMHNAALAYWEIDENYPTLGKGCWALPDGGSNLYSRFFTDSDNTCKIVGLETKKWIFNGISPDGNDIYGEAFTKQGAYWTDGNNGGGNYWILIGYYDDTAVATWHDLELYCAAWKNITYQMTSVSVNNGGICGRGFANTHRKD